MKVQELMSRDVRTCSPEANLAEVTAIMWDADCGIVPVVNERGEAVGVVTDRDLCMALGTRNVRPSDLTAREVMTTPVVGCAPEDSMSEALALMERHRVRRLPVLGIGGIVLGMLSVNDIVLHGYSVAVKEPLLVTLRAVCAHRHPTPLAHAV